MQNVNPLSGPDSSSFKGATRFGSTVVAGALLVLAISLGGSVPAWRAHAAKATDNNHEAAEWRLEGPVSGFLETVLSFGVLEEGATDSSAKNEATLKNAQINVAQTEGPRESCATAVAWAEHAYDMPRGLVAAIALTESAINAYAVGTTKISFTEEDRRKAEVFASAQGVNFAIGCMQLYWRWHKGSFATLSEAFEAKRNVAVASDFLMDLKERRKTWAAAVAAYHGGDTADRRAYLCRVHAKLTEIGGDSAALGSPKCNQRIAARMRERARMHIESLDAQFALVRNDG
jgi:soluble lytic murein transglycosylase-like protein